MQVLKQEKSRIEDPTVAKALTKLGIPSIPLKMVLGSETGRPDQVFLIPGGRPLFIEFKWDGEEPDPKQVYWGSILKAMGYDVQIHNDVQQALEAIAVEVVASALHAEGSQVLIRAWCRNPYAGPRFEENLHYSRSIQFLEETGRSEQDARDRTVKSVLSSLARRDCEMARLQSS